MDLSMSRNKIVFLNGLNHLILIGYQYPRLKSWAIKNKHSQETFKHINVDNQVDKTAFWQGIFIKIAHLCSHIII